MNRVFLARCAAAFKAERRVIDAVARRAAQDPWWGLTYEEGVAQGVPHLERQGPFQAQLGLYLPNYDLLKVWSQTQTRLRWLAPSSWPPRWRPAFMARLKGGHWPLLYRVGEPMPDTTTTPAARLEAWIQRCPGSQQ